MKLTMTMVLVMSMVASVFAGSYDLHVDATKLFTGLEKAENGAGNPNLVGDKHLKDHAYGLLQIRQPYLDDVNRIAGADVKASWGKAKLTIADMKDQAKARWAAKVYLSYYGERYEKQTGRIPTAEVYAKMHNGGPMGWRRGNYDTRRYWARVLKINGDWMRS